MAVELDPCDGDERPAGPSQYRRVRLLPMHATDGVLDVSDSSDVEASAESPQPEPVLPPLDERPCVDAAPVDVKDARLLPLFFSMWTQHQSELLAGLDGGLRLDIPEWASELFRDGRGWTPEAAAGSAGKKPARWGRCSYPSCSGRAFRPVLGARGPLPLVLSSWMSRRRGPSLEHRVWMAGGAGRRKPLLGSRRAMKTRLHAMSMRRNGATCFTMPRNGMPPQRSSVFTCSDEGGDLQKGSCAQPLFPTNFPRLTNLKHQAPNFQTLGPTDTFSLSAHSVFVARLHRLSFRWFFGGLVP